MKKKFLLNSIYALFIYAGLFCSCSNETELKSENDGIKSKTLSVEDIVNNLETSFEPSVRVVGDDITKNYPDYYCGYYYVDNQLVIWITDTANDSYRQDLERRCGGTGFVIQQAQHSYNELSLIRDKVSESKQRGVWEKYKVTGCGIDTEQNKILVLLADVSAENIKGFEAEFPEYPSMFIFLHLAPVVENENNSIMPLVDIDSTVPVIPGANYYASGGDSGTVGYKTTYQNKPAFVTTAHSVGAVNNSIKDVADYTTIVGYVEARDLTGYDLAVCSIKDGFASSNQFTFMGSSVTLVANTYQTPIEGKTKVGCKTYYSNAGQETAIVFKTGIELAGRSQKVFALAAYKAQSGDSGSLVFCPDNRYAVGIHVANYTSSTLGSYSAFLPCSYIKAKYGTLPQN